MKLKPLMACVTLFAGTVVVLSGTTAAAASVRYEAETAPATCDGTIDTNWSGYSGSGFCNGRNAIGAAAQFTVDASASGTATFGIRFANGASAARPADLIVNGSTVQAASFEATGAWATWITKTVTVSLNSGSNTIRLNPTTTAGLPNIDRLDLEVPTQRYEAETAPATCDGTIDSNHAGFSGSGFCNGANGIGAAAQFTVNASASGTATVGIRFANGASAARAADLIVNGSTVQAASFEATGAWATWITKTVTVSLNSGSNTIRLNPTTTAGLPNIDYLDVTIGGSPQHPSTGTGKPDDPNLQYYGRWNTSNLSYYSMGWAGGYLDARFTGTSIGVRQRNSIDLYYSIDGAALQWRRNVSGNVTLATGLANTSHTIRIGYRERAGSYNGDPVFGGLILAGGGQTTPISRPAHFIEYIGDSITVGQPNSNRPFTAYGWVTAEALGAGHTQVAQGGACLVSQDCYGMMDWFRRSSAWASSDDWDFSRYQASAVVINLGTNDIGHGVTGPQFHQNYITMLERVRLAYPNAEIFAMGVFRNRYVTETRNAVSARRSAGDTKVHFIDTAGWVDPATDTHDNVHPTDAGHAKIARLLTPILDQYL